MDREISELAARLAGDRDRRLTALEEMVGDYSEGTRSVAERLADRFGGGLGSGSRKRRTVALDGLSGEPVSVHLSYEDAEAKSVAKRMAERFGT